MSLSRRHFLGLAASGAASLSLATPGLAQPAAPAARTATRPTAIASGNGLRGVARAVALMQEDGADPLDAAIAGVNIQELDPEDQTVGLGGLPNEHGIVQLDASCMHGPTRRAGAVGALEGIATPSLVAKAIMDYTDHIMLVGEGAKRFALSMGFEEQNLLTEESRQDWLRWKARLNPRDNWLDHDDDVQIKFSTGTINLCAVNAAGDLGSVTTTSGLAWKLPSRVGDSPIIGAGQYCDNEVGAAGSTGRGEANIMTCGAFLTVEFMRQGLSPTEACLRTLERVVAQTPDRLLEDGRPLFGLNFYAVAKDGSYGSATIYARTEAEQERGVGFFAVADAEGARRELMASLYTVDQRPASMRR
ncbi:MAG: N(4)-(beta-N-acetylglucosaminyl)-L-asparaginase [Bacteroidota bacterium]